MTTLMFLQDLSRVIIRKVEDLRICIAVGDLSLITNCCPVPKSCKELRTNDYRNTRRGACKTS